MQTAKGAAACSICKEEFQAFMKLYVLPRVERMIKERVQREESHTTVPTYQGTHARHSLKQIVHNLRTTLDESYAALQQGLWNGRPGVATEAYRPCMQYPFFLSMDNGPAHSWFLGEGQKEHVVEPGCSLMQLLFMSPHGHDMHQIVEHTIGVIKRGVRRDIVESAINGDVSLVGGCHIIHNAVQRLSQLVTAESICKGLHRLQNALRQIAAHKGEVLWLTERDGKRVKVLGTGGSYSSYL
jgi:hypothetical protein